MILVSVMSNDHGIVADNKIVSLLKYCGQQQGREVVGRESHRDRVHSPIGFLELNLLGPIAFYLSKVFYPRCDECLLSLHRYAGGWLWLLGLV